MGIVLTTPSSDALGPTVSAEFDTQTEAFAYLANLSRSDIERTRWSEK